MGGGPDKEHMLIVFWDEEPTTILDRIRSRFPYIETTYFTLKNSSNPLQDDSSRVPKDRQTETTLAESRDEEARIELFRKATILVTFATLPPTPEDAPNLKFIQLFSAGIDNIANHPIIKNSEIPITTVSGIHGPPIAEWVLMTTLATTKQFTVAYEQQKRHVWARNGSLLSEGADWVVARIFTAMGSKVLAYTAMPRTTSSQRADQGFIIPGTGDPDGSLPTAWYSGTSKADLHNFLRQELDLLVICLPLTPSTAHLFSTAEFDILAAHASTNPITNKKRKGAYVANISRGKILDQDALIAALNAEKLRGAFLDVADPEPLPKDSPLWDAKNVTITPHMSALGEEYAERAYDVLMENLARRERGERLVNLIDRKKGY